jgi:pimeloyl-ACP methyl ester carboxylesterase
MKRSLLVLLIFLVAATLPNGVSAAPPAGSPVADPSGDFAGLIELGNGHHIYAECAGTGGPTVLLVSGYRTRADVWTDPQLGPGNGDPMVLPAIADTTRVCAYDRPGTLTVLDDVRYPSRSDDAPMPRSIAEVVAELRAVREMVADDQPVVLVGHSLGGAIVRLYAATYPEDVAGIVLVDAYSEFLADHMPPEAFAAYAEYASVIPDFLSDYIAYETIDFAQTSDALRDAAAASPLPAIPYEVLSKGQPFGLEGDTPGFTIDQLETAWPEAQADLAALLPGTEHVTVADSSHYIQLQRPDLVIAAIEQVVDEVRLEATPTP